MRELDINELNNVTGGVLMSNGKPLTQANINYIKGVLAQPGPSPVKPITPPASHPPIGFNPNVGGGRIME